METSEVDEYDSCGSSDISDLDELEEKLYSHIHHEKNYDIEEEYSTGIKVSSVEVVCQQNGNSVDENFGQNFSVSSDGDPTSLGVNENTSECEVNVDGEIVDSTCFVTRSDSDSICSVHSSGKVAVQLSGEKARTSGICTRSRDSSPSVLEIGSSDDSDEINVSKYKLPAASTPVKECVVIDDSDQEVQVEFERVNVKMKKKKKKRKKSDIKADIQINTRNNFEIVCLDVEEESIFSEKENIASLSFDQGYQNLQLEESVCQSWTPQMVQFYDESWGGEFINVSDLQKTMSDDGWHVDMSDEALSLAMKFQNRRYFGVKTKAWCTNCNQRGHYRNKCTEKPNTPRCHRCGSSRHQEYSCNQKICLTCGKKRSALVAVCQQCRQCSWKKCNVCHQHGHPAGCCPDLWRRFHATIAPGEIISPKVSYKDPKNTYCCNCASRGHHVFQCKKDSFSEYIPMNPKVLSYVDPEVLLKFQNTCSRTSTNWESVGYVAPESQDEFEQSHGYPDRGIKRPKFSGNQQKSKKRKLNKNTVVKTLSSASISETKDKNSDKSAKRNKIKKSVNLKAKKVMKTKMKNKKDKHIEAVGNKKQANPSSQPEKNVQHKDNSIMKDAATNTGINEIATSGINPEPNIMERIILLSPGHFKRMASEEGKEILKHVTDQFKGVSAKVFSHPRKLKLKGARNKIDQFKAKLFDILNNKCGLNQVESSLNANRDNLQVKKPRSTDGAVIKSKNVMKFQNGYCPNKKFDMRYKDQYNTTTTDSVDLQTQVKRVRRGVKKKFTGIQKLKCPVQNGKGNDLNYINPNEFKRRNNNKKNGMLTKNKRRFIKLDAKNNGAHSVTNQAKKFRSNLVNGLDNLGSIQVEVGNTRKVFIYDKCKSDHSKNYKYQQSSQNYHLPVQESMVNFYQSAGTS